MTWTPYLPDAQGLGWMATREPGVKLEGFSAGAASLREGAQATESVAAVWVYLNRSGVDVEDGYEVSVYDLDDLEEGDLSTVVVRPDADVRVVNAARWSYVSGSSDVDLWAGVDSTALVPSDYQGRGVPNGEFVFPLYGQGAEVVFSYSALGGAFTGTSVTAVRARAMACEIVWPAGQQPVGGATISPVLHIGGNLYLGPPTMVPANGSPVEVSAEWLANPATGRSWTPTDLDELAGLLGGTSGIGWQITATGSPNWLPVVLQGWVEVDSAPVDKRLAVGVIRPGPSIVGSWQRIPLLDPADGTPATWAKTIGQRSLVVLRRRWGTGWALWRRVLGDGTYPNGWQQGQPVVLPSGRLAGLVDGVAAALGPITDPGGYGLLLERSDGDLSVDSQPYISVNDDVSGRSGFFNYWTRVDASQSLTQEFTTGSAVDVGFARVLAALEDPECEDLLTVEVVDPAGPTVLASVTFDPAALGDDPTSFEVLEDYLDGVASLGSGQYELVFSCPAPAGEGWRVQVLSAGRIGGPTLTPADVPDIAFGLGADELIVGATAYGELTAAAQVHTLPDPPTGFAATASGPVDNVDAVELEWTPPSVPEGGGFAGVEIERRDDRTDWQRVAYITDDAATEWWDYEARLDVESTWRARTRRVDGSASVWTDEATATPTGPPCGWVLASNEAPSWSGWWDSIGPVVSFEFPEQVSEHRPIGANGSLVLRELEDRLDRFKLTLFLAGLGSLTDTPQVPAVAGRQQVFDPLRVLIGNRRDPSTGRKLMLSYVCVLAPGGDRWFAGITTQGGEVSEPDGSYSMRVTVTEQTDVAAVVTVEAGPS